MGLFSTLEAHSVVFSRDELLSKIIQICSQNDYQYISNFEWYVSVLVELSQLEGGGGRHGAILAQQMMDVAIRVAAIRPFATQQMALLVENSAVIMAKGKRNSSAEVGKILVTACVFLCHLGRCCMRQGGW